VREPSSLHVRMCWNGKVDDNRVYVHLKEETDDLYKFIEVIEDFIHNIKYKPLCYTPAPASSVR